MVFREYTIISPEIYALNASIVNKLYMTKKNINNMRNNMRY